MIKRTPLIRRVPSRLTRAVVTRRTPVINGRYARPMADLVVDPESEPGDVEVSLKLSEIAPELEPIWEQAHDDMIRSSLSYFFSEVISGPQDAPYHGRSLVGRHHVEWDDIVSEHDRFLIEAARDHGKSHFFSLAYPIWMGGYVKPGSLGYLFSATQKLAEQLLALIRQELLTNPRLAHLVPTTRDNNWSASEIRLRTGSVIRARGVGVKIRGGHPHWIIVDDGLSDEDIYSETIRNKTINYYLSAIVNMIVPGGQIGVVGTPMHFADLYGYLKRTGSYHHRAYPAIDKQRILFPERYDRKRLEGRKRELGVARFAREFLCQPMTDEASLFPSTLFEGNKVRLPYTLGLGASYWEQRGMVRYTGIDFAMSSSAQADWTVIFTVAVDAQGVRYLANMRRGQGWGFQRQLDEIKEEYALMRPDVIHAEANQMQRIFTDELIRETDLPIRKFFTSGVQPKQPWRKGMTSLTAGKHNIDRGVPSIRMGLENGKWRIPRGDEHSIAMTDIWMGECQAMTWHDGRVVSVGTHDDTVMAMWICDSAVRMGGFTFSFGDEEVQDQMKDAQPPVGAPPAAKIAQVSGNGDKPGVVSDDWRPKEGAPIPGAMGYGIGFGDF